MYSATLIYTLSLHDALPISGAGAGAPVDPADVVAACVGAGDRADLADAVAGGGHFPVGGDAGGGGGLRSQLPDRKSTRLNSSHVARSYAVCCMKKKKRSIHRT